ncbi:hypothetical protein B7494_g945 [Chlorociboria aeruginascens]|nr:hypothetical protein B7494_g945 [Chlorociboria aeruginascens]
MAEEGEAAPVPTTLHNEDEHHGPGGPIPIHIQSRKSTWSKSDIGVAIGEKTTPSSTLGGLGGNRNSRHSIDLDDYFVGPRDMDRHSKLPYFLRLHGSVLPRMIVPLFLIGGWATIITCISEFVTPLGVNTLLLTVLGFVVGLALSFKSSTAYERYSEGRRAWATLSVQSRNLARMIWMHIEEREGEEGKDDLLGKLTGINLVLAFAVALKHKLRFEPYAHYPDINSLVSHLDTFAKAAYSPEVVEEKKKTPWKAIGEYLGIQFASSNPRKAIKRATKPVGHLPMEILTYLSAYFEAVSANKTLGSPVVFGQVYTMSTAERVLNTPLPIGYNILISQIVLLYVYLLPFQLYDALKWITIPGTVAAAYIIIGLAAIGNELENPFGNDVNDLPLDQYCADIAAEMDVLTSVPAPKLSNFVGGENQVLWPLSRSGFEEWRGRSVADIRSALNAKVVVGNRAGSIS